MHLLACVCVCNYIIQDLVVTQLLQTNVLASMQSLGKSGKN